MNRLMVVALFVLVFAAPLVAQDLAEDPATTPTQWYSTIAGISAATVLGVGILKRLLAKVPYLSAVPLWVYAILISGALTYLSNQVWHTMPGELWPLLTEAVKQAAIASGFYAWFTSDTGGLMKSFAKPLSSSLVSQDIISKG